MRLTWLLSPPLSVTVTTTGYTPAAAYVCDPEAVPDPFASFTVPATGALPSPNVHDAVCVSLAASVKLALTESDGADGHRIVRRDRRDDGSAP